MLYLNEAPGVHRVEDANTNWYLVEEDGELCVVDTGLPGSWRSLQSSLRTLDRPLDAIRAVVLTHGHFDHMGFARRLQQERGVAVRGHELERELIAQPWSYRHERPRPPYLRYPHFARTLLEMTAMGALWVGGVQTVAPYRDGEVLDVPGRPRVLHTPGHTFGHCSLLLEDRGVLLAGDAFVMRDPYTGRPGPCVVAGAATADSQQALASLDRLAEVDATVTLTGHGAAWRGAPRDAATLARAAGPA